MLGALDRVTTGVQGLDLILGGGFVRGGAYVVQGRPGTGKTILTNQVCFHHARGGGRVLYVTLLAESHTHMFQNLGTLDFFDRNVIGDGVYYVNANRMLTEGGLDSLINLLRAEMKRQRASLLVLDGLLNVRESADSDIDLKRCLQALQGQAEFAGCTLLMLTSAGLDEVSPEHTMVDGIIGLTDELAGVRAIRHLQVRKFRGSPHLRGLHQFDITGSGVVVFARLEARYAYPSRDAAGGFARVSIGNGRLDAMLGGGLPAHSATLLLGASGTGKTTLGLQFLASSTPDEPGLHFSFYETPARLTRKAAAFGVDLDALRRSGALDVLWAPPTENLLDELGERLLDAVERQGARRVFLDGIGGFSQAAADSGRLMSFATALLNELRGRGVSILASWELPRLFGGAVDAPVPEISSIVENLLLLRFVETRARIRRLLAILKVCDSDYDPRLMEFVIGAGGIEVSETGGGAEALLSGFPRPPGPSDPAER